MTRGVFVLIAVLSLVLLAAGSVSAVQRARLGREFTLGAGQTVVIRGERLSVTFSQVTEDSRCPTGATCVWEGNAQIAVTVSKPSNEPQKLLLNTNGSFPTKATYLNYIVRLLRLDPYPTEGGVIRERDYRATLVVTKT